MQDPNQSLLDLCVASAASSDAWRFQRRALERLPEHAADALLEKLLAQGRIERSLQLELFRHSVTCVRIVGGQQGGAYAAAAARLVDASFMAYVSEFSHLSTLHLDGCPKLRDAHLSRLVARAPTLTSLHLPRCTGLTAGCIPEAICHLTSLHTLDLSETGIRSPAGAALSRLPDSLTHLQLAGLPSLSDSCCAEGLPHLSNLSTLSLWNTGVGLATLELLSVCCPKLSTLDISLTRVDALPAMPSLTALNMQHCTLSDVWWPGGPPSPADLAALLPDAAAPLARVTAQISTSNSTSDSCTNSQPASAHTCPSLLPLTQLNLGSCTLSGGSAAAAAVCQALACAAPTVTALDLSNVPGLVLSHPAHPSASGGKGAAAAAGLTSAAALMAACSSLHSLDMSGAGWLQAADLEGMVLGPGATKALRVLKLQGCSKLGEAGAQQLGNISSLEDLDVTGCDFGDAEVRWLCQLTSLTRLVLDSNPRLTGDLAPSTQSTAPSETPAMGVAGSAGAGEASAPAGGPAVAAEPATAATGYDRGPAQSMAAVWQPDRAPRPWEMPEEDAAASTGTAGSSSQRGCSTSHAAGWTALQSLRSLSLCGTGLREAGVRQVAAGLGGALTQLRLGSAGIGDRAVREIAQKMKALEELELQGLAKVSARGAAHLTSLPVLTRLRADGSWLAAEAGAWQQLLVDSPSLQHVEADGRRWKRGAQVVAQPSSGSGSGHTPAPLRDDKIRYSRDELEWIGQHVGCLLKEWREANTAGLADLLA